MPIRVREIEPQGMRTGAALPTEAELQQLRAELYGGPELEPDEVRVRRMLLCHDQYDRTCERFTPEYLEQFARTIPGKSVLGGHDTNQLPLGRFFGGAVVARKELFPVLCKAAPVEQVPGFIARETRVRYLEAPFYYAAADPMGERLEAGIRTGIFRSVSIGFRYDDLECDLCRKSYFSDCPHYLGERTEEGDLVTGTYAGDATKAEALEGSIVFLGAQPGARILKGLALEGSLDVRAAGLTPWGVDDAVRKTAEILASRYGAPRAIWPAAKPGPAAEEKAMTEEQVRQLQGELESARVAMEAHAVRIEQLEREAAEAREQVRILRQERQDDEPWVAAGKAALADLSERYLTAVRAMGESERAAQIIIESSMRRVDYAGLRELAEHQHLRVCEKFPDRPAGEPGRVEPLPPQPAARRERLVDLEIV